MEIEAYFGVHLHSWAPRFLEICALQKGQQILIWRDQYISINDFSINLFNICLKWFKCCNLNCVSIHFFSAKDKFRTHFFEFLQVFQHLHIFVTLKNRKTLPLFAHFIHSLTIDEPWINPKKEGKYFPTFERMPLQSVNRNPGNAFYLPFAICFAMICLNFYFILNYNIQYT